MRLVRAVGNERHRMLQFLRFEHLENGVWFARWQPERSGGAPAHGLVQRPLQHPAVHHFRREPRHGRRLRGPRLVPRAHRRSEPARQGLRREAHAGRMETLLRHRGHRGALQPPSCAASSCPSASGRTSSRCTSTSPAKTSRTRGAIPKANGAARSPRPQYARRRRSGTSMLGGDAPAPAGGVIPASAFPAATLPTSAFRQHAQCTSRWTTGEGYGSTSMAVDGARRLSGRDFEVCDLETCRNDCTQECDVVLPVRKISTHPGAGSRSIKNHIPRNLCHFEPCRRFVPSGNAAGRRFVPGGKSSFHPGCRYGRSLPRSCHGALARADAGSTVGPSPYTPANSKAGQKPRPCARACSSRTYTPVRSKGGMKLSSAAPPSCQK